MGRWRKEGGEGAYVCLSMAFIRAQVHRLMKNNEAAMNDLDKVISTLGKGQPSILRQVKEKKCKSCMHCPIADIIQGIYTTCYS